MSKMFHYDQIITILYSGYETVSTTSMMAVKYLHDHPRVLEELRVSEKKKNLNFELCFLSLFHFFYFDLLLKFFSKNIWQLEKGKGQRIQLSGMILRQ